MRSLLVSLGALACIGSVLTTQAGAEVRRIEAVGSVPVRSDGRGDPRQQAIQAALHESVSRVASEFLLDAPELDPEAPSLADVLGDDLVPYASRFRILEDRGERPALFADDPSVRTEYVVVVEVQVDVDRVRARLAEAGLIAADPEQTGGRRVRLEVRGLQAYPAYEALREVLLSEAGALSVVPTRFERGRAWLDVETPLGTAELAERLERSRRERLQVVAVGGQGDTLRLAVRWTPPPDGTGAD